MKSFVRFIIGVVSSIIGLRKSRGGTAKVIFTAATFENFRIIGDIETMELKEGYKADIEVLPKTKAGHAAGIEPGTARFTSSDESIVSVVQDPDNELKATIRGLDGSHNESALVEFRADADKSEEVREIVATLAVICTQGDAVTAEITAGTPAVDDGADLGPAQPAGDSGETPADNAAGGDVDGAGQPDEAGAPDARPETEGNPNPTDSTPADTNGPKDSESDPNSGNDPAEPAELDGANPKDPEGGVDVDEADHVSDVPPADDAGPMTFTEAAADTAERNSDPGPASPVDAAGEPD